MTVKQQHLNPIERTSSALLFDGWSRSARSAGLLGRSKRYLQDESCIRSIA